MCSKNRLTSRDVSTATLFALSLEKYPGKVIVEIMNFPLFSIWDRDELVHGWPLLPTAAFVIWLLLIVALAVLLETGGTAATPPPGDDAEQRGLPPD